MSTNIPKLSRPAWPMKFKGIVTKTNQPNKITDSFELTDLRGGKGPPYMEVIQSIGRKDMDGIEVYYGDVLHFEKHGFAGLARGCVQWDKLGMNLRLVTAKGGIIPLFRCSDGRVIGNIIANPELMEAE